MIIIKYFVSVHPFCCVDALLKIHNYMASSYPASASHHIYVYTFQRTSLISKTTTTITKNHFIDIIVTKLNWLRRQNERQYKLVEWLKNILKPMLSLRSVCLLVFYCSCSHYNMRKIYIGKKSIVSAFWNPAKWKTQKKRELAIARRIGSREIQ